MTLKGGTSSKAKLAPFLLFLTKTSNISAASNTVWKEKKGTQSLCSKRPNIRALIQREQ